MTVESQNALFEDQEFTNEYEKMIAAIIPGYNLMFEAAGTFLSNVHEEAHLLIVGAGGGKELSLFGSSHPNWIFTGVDPSQPMLEFALEKVEHLGMNERVQLVKGFVEEIPQEVNFDAATCMLVLHFLPDDQSKLALLENIKNRLKPGAPLLLSVPYGDKESPEYKKIMEASEQFYRSKGVSKDMIQEHFDRIQNDVSILSEEKIKRLLEQAGFEMVTQFFTSFNFGGWYTKRKA
ncbi:class I SAM-dependent methyltransferase [Niallia sp. Krafla_26]|uniref:class I SAM-dependent methyltransferase n=1 Tax=Niallia sp. Krafla_26 TaxID=3064703 RepID=UPI003D1868D1